MREKPIRGCGVERGGGRLVSGPRRDGDEDGPEEFHLVLVDNGRYRLLADPDLREALYCIRCGACLNICPVYQKVGGHAYGWVYPGPIGAVVSPALLGLKQAKDLPFASSLCGACREVCPVKINIPRMLLHQRHLLSESTEPEERSVSLSESLMARLFTSVMSKPALLTTARKLVRLLAQLWARKGIVRRAPLPPASRWTHQRDLPTLPQRSFRDIWKKELASGAGGAPAGSSQAPSMNRSEGG